MKAVVFHDVGDIRLETVSDPMLEGPTDAIVRLTASAICGTDLHMIRGTLGGMKAGTVLGHEGVGIVEEIGAGVRNLNAGDRVVIPSTIACGVCSYCRAGYFAQCDKANPNGPDSGTAFFGGPESSGPFNGLQAEKARIPFANVGLFKLPSGVSDNQAILLSDIFPTGYSGAEMARIKPGRTVAVFGCGPVGQFAIASAKLMGAGRIFAIDNVQWRLDMARAQGAEAIDFDAEDPVEAVKDLTGGIGADCAIDAVGVDAVTAHHGPAARGDREERKKLMDEAKEIAPHRASTGDHWKPGDAPAQALFWAVRTLAKAGTLSIIGVYSEKSRLFPIGEAVEKNLTMRMGNCHHRRYIPKLVELVEMGAVNPAEVLSQREPLVSALDAYRAFDERQPGWMKVKLDPVLTQTPV
jgi:threonine dehydrogenase-like Zn-dependent dehydrogenase